VDLSGCNAGRAVSVSRRLASRTEVVVVSRTGGDELTGECHELVDITRRRASPRCGGSKKVSHVPFRAGTMKLGLGGVS